jgi:hypothetical protein
VKTHQQVVWRHWSVTKLASITFLSLTFSYWIVYLGFITEGRLVVVLIIPSLEVPNLSVIYIINTAPSSKFSGAVVEEKEDFCKGSLARTIFYFVFSFALFYFCLHLFIKNTKKLVSISSCFFMSSLVAANMSPEEMIFTFKQKSEESFKEAWSKIYDWHGKTKPKMTLSSLLSSFYFGLALRYRYALDATAEGDFLYCDGDQAFNIIKVDYNL